MLSADFNYRYFIKFAYNGAKYHGWQVQPNAKSVQEVLDLQLSLLFKHHIETVGAGRTDTGVHASCMYAHFNTNHLLENPDSLVFKLNKMLPEDIVVYQLLRVNNNAHARFDAVSRTYQYHVHRFKDVFVNNQSLYLFGNINVDLMNEACKILLQHNDFACFSKSHTDVKTTICHIEKAEWNVENDIHLVFTIKANRFLRNMVRAIVGTMLEIGQGKMSLDGFINVLESKNRSLAGQSVAAKALFLTDIVYPGTIFIVNE